MDTKAKTTKIVKDLQDSAREFGVASLNMASKAVAFTTTHLTNLKDEMEKLGSKLKTEAKADDAKPVDETPKQ